MGPIKRLSEPLRRRIETISKDSGRSPLISLERAIACFSAVYGGVMALRASLYEKEMLPAKRLPCRVVAIGNLAAGGTGKTPMTIYVARLIHELGFRVAVVSRGYRGGMESSGGVVSDGVHVLRNAVDAGDEPCLMAKVLPGVPVIVGKDRHAAGVMAIRRFNTQVIVLDDAFQHLKLKRDLNLVLLDDRLPFGNGHLLPRGVLREPRSALRRADSVICTRSQAAGGACIANRMLQRNGKPVFRAGHAPVIRTSADNDTTGYLTRTQDLSILSGKRIVAFAGLADNGQFFDSLVAGGCRIVHRHSFADHQHYSSLQIDSIMTDAQTLGVDFVVTTLKDAVKITVPEKWPTRLLAIDVDIDLFGDDDRFRRFILRTLDLPARCCDVVSPRI